MCLFCVELITFSFLDLIFKQARLNAAVSGFLLNHNSEAVHLLYFKKWVMTEGSETIRVKS